MAGRPIRLGKAAGELNVGLDTIVEFLSSKGIKIDATPNSKLTQEHYELLCDEFAADQDLKEKSKGVLSHREKRESLSIEDSKTVEEPEKIVEPAINIEEIKRQVKEETSLVKKPEKDLKVVGKIDLEALNKKPKPKPEPEAKPEAKVEEIKTPEEPKQKNKELTSPEEIETIKVDRKKISGPTVLEKIELPVKKEKSPAGSSKPDHLNKRKRKRIKKIEVPPTGNKTAPSKSKNSKTDKPEISERDIQKEIKFFYQQLNLIEQV